MISERHLKQMQMISETNIAFSTLDRINVETIIHSSKNTQIKKFHPISREAKDYI